MDSQALLSRHNLIIQLSILMVYLVPSFERQEKKEILYLFVGMVIKLIVIDEHVEEWRSKTQVVFF